MTLPRAAFLDRDGVINRAVVREGKPYPPATVEEVEILPGAAEAILRLRGAGYAVVVVTNQPDIARGATTQATVDAIHAHMKAELGLDDIRVCPHDDARRVRLPQTQARAPAPNARLRPGRRA